MAHQASVDNPQWSSPNGNGKSAAAGVRDGIGELLHDVVSLGELQSQLLVVDAKESVQKAQTPLVLLAVGLALGLGAVPVLLLALGEAFTLWLNWERALSYLISGVAGAALAGLLSYLAIRQSGEVVAVFKRSRDELAENVRWIKYALTRGRRPPR